MYVRTICKHHFHISEGNNSDIIFELHFFLFSYFQYISHNCDLLHRINEYQRYTWSAGPVYIIIQLVTPTHCWLKHLLVFRYIAIFFLFLFFQYIWHKCTCINNLKASNKILLFIWIKQIPSKFWFEPTSINQ